MPQVQFNARIYDHIWQITRAVVGTDFVRKARAGHV